jgi:hypothetical protein
MVLAMAFDEASKIVRKPAHDYVKTSKGGGTNTKFFDFRDAPDMPHASLNQHDQGYYNGTHFHIVDQFQVVVEGEGTLGRHQLSPYVVHFTRAYTPYGPLLSNASDGLTFFALRAHRDRGPQSIPKEMEQLKRVANRRPWQRSTHVTFPTLPSNATKGQFLMDVIPQIKDDYGLAAYALSATPDSMVSTPDPAHGDGQYLVAVKGSLFVQDKEYKAKALVFIRPQDGSLQFRAGSDGLEAFILNFPRARSQAVSSALS